MAKKIHKNENLLHIFVICNQMNAIVAYEYIKENKINYNDIRIFLSRDISALGLFEGMNFINCKRGFIQKIGDHFFSALSYGSLIKKTIESEKQQFIYYVSWLDDISMQIVDSIYCIGHIYFEEGDQSYREDFPLFSPSPDYKRIPKKIIHHRNFVDFYRDDGMLWIGVSEKSFPTAPVKKKYILRSFDNFKKVYRPLLKEYKTILLMPSPGRLPRSEWKKAISKLAHAADEPFALKLHPGFGVKLNTYKEFQSYLIDLGFTQSIVCSDEVIIEGEMLSHKKVLIGDRSSLSRYAGLFGSIFLEIEFLYGKAY